MSVVLGTSLEVQTSLGNMNSMYRSLNPDHWVMLDKVKSMVVENPSVFSNYILQCRFRVNEIVIRFAPKGKHYFEAYANDNNSLLELSLTTHMTNIVPQSDELKKMNRDKYTIFSDRFKERYGHDGLPNLVDIFLVAMGVSPIYSKIEDGYPHLAWTFSDTSKNDFEVTGTHYVFYSKHIMAIHVNISTMAELMALGMLAV